MVPEQTELPNLQPPGCSLKANMKIGSRWKKQTGWGFWLVLWKPAGLKCFLLNVWNIFLSKDSIRNSFFMCVCVSEVVNMFTHDKCGSHVQLQSFRSGTCMGWVALQPLSCLLTVLNKWPESPLLQGGSWNPVYMLDYDYSSMFCVRVAPPWPRGFLSPRVLEVRGRVIIEHCLALLTNVLKERIEKPVN